MLRILVTGAAGLIGAEVCGRLVASGHQVTAMVRRNREILSNDGVDVPVAQIVAGDITQPLMGLDPAEIGADLVIHCAASLEFDAPEEALRAINIEGTRNALALTKAVGASFLHVSTAYVCGTKEGPVLEEPASDGQQFANRYEASKAAGEAVVMASGVPYAIARPSITLGDSTSGAIRDFPSLCNVFRLMARGKVTQFPSAKGSTLNLVPIDHVAAGIVAIAQQMEQAEGSIFHLVAQDPLLAAELARGVARVEHFPDPQVVDPQQFDLAKLSPIEQRVAGRMLATFGGYFTRDPQFCDAKFRALTGLKCPPTDAAWLDMLVAYAITRGYLPKAPQNTSTNAQEAAA